MKLRTRLTLYLNGLLLLTLALVAGVGIWMSLRDLRDRAKRDAIDTASLLANAGIIAVEPVPDARPPADGWPSRRERALAESRVRLAERDAWRRMIATLAHSPSDVANFQTIFVAEQNGQLVGSHSRLPQIDPVAEYWDGIDRVAERARQRGLAEAAFLDNSLVAAVPLPYKDHDGWVFVCTFSTRYFDRMAAAAMRRIGGLSIIALLAGALVSSMLARRISQPIRDLARATQIIGEGEFNHRIRVRSGDELGMLAWSFNRMADSLKQSIRRLAAAAAEQEAQDREMALAAEMQASFLPVSCPDMGCFDVAARSIPAREVGGDFYDFIPLPDGRWGIVVADVAGKGLPAAMFMGFSRCLIRAYSHQRPSTIEVMQMANDFMLNDVHYDMFVTCFYAVIDPEREMLSYVNAGHNPAVVRRTGGEFATLPASGIPLGVWEQDDIRQDLCRVSVGDVILLYTDGITEATDDSGEQFGMARLEEVVQDTCELSAEDICERVIQAVESFAAGKSQFDDMTVVAVKVQEYARAESHAEVGSSAAGQLPDPSAGP